MISTSLLVLVLIPYVVYSCFLLPFIFSPIRSVPGPKSFAVSKWRLAYEDLKGSRTRKIYQLHLKYGPVVRIGPNEVSFNSISALRTIYGPGSGFERTAFYQMFDVYGHKNLFTFHSVQDHAERKKILAHSYSKSVILKGEEARLVEDKVAKYLQLITNDREAANEIFSSLHYFSIDVITDFLYGKFGRTDCLSGLHKDRLLLTDIMDTSRRRLSWLTVHFPAFTRWLYSLSGILGRLVRPFLPMQRPTTYTGIRAHALRAFFAFRDSVEARKLEHSTIISKIWKHHCSQKEGGLTDMDVASECADHLLAGIDTTSDSLMFLIWALSRPEARNHQEQLRKEVTAMPPEALNYADIPTVEACDKLPYLDAVIKETLRLYAPLPSSEPRSNPKPVTIDGYLIPGGTIVSMSPYTLHRNPEVFKDPLKSDPERWLADGANLAEMKKWWWAFSSGARMCIGMQ
jgi:hypothetical protein